MKDTPPSLGYSLCLELGLWGSPPTLACRKEAYRIHPGAQQTGPGDWEAGRKEGTSSKWTIWSGTQLL